MPLERGRPAHDADRLPGGGGRRRPSIRRIVAQRDQPPTHEALASPAIAATRPWQPRRCRASSPPARRAGAPTTRTSRTTCRGRSAWSARTAARFDLRSALSQVEMNAPLGPDVFEVKVPPSAQPITLDELQRSGDGVRPAQSNERRVTAGRRSGRSRRSTSRCACWASRHDGYHELRTVFQSIALHDTLDRSSRPGARSRSRPTIRPARSIAPTWSGARPRWCGARPDVEARRAASRVTIEKRIPMQAGLGGGSSDAAAALRVLSACWHPAIERRAAASAWPPRSAPTCRSSSRAAPRSASSAAIGCFRWPTRRRRGSCWRCPFRRQDAGRLSAGGMSGCARRAATAVARVAFAAASRSLWGRRQRSAGAGAAASPGDRSLIVGACGGRARVWAAMSGSGSAVFGLFETERAAERAADLVRRPPMSGADDADAVSPTISSAVGAAALESSRASRNNACDLLAKKPIGYTYRLRRVVSATPEVQLLQFLSSRVETPAQCRSAGVEVRARRLRIRSDTGGRRRLDGAWPSGKARDFGSRIRRFESFRPSQLARGCRLMGDPVWRRPVLAN